MELDREVFSRQTHPRLQRRLLVAGGMLMSMIIAAIPSLAGACQLGKMADFPVSMDNLQPEVTAKVNGSEVRFVLDSGAFYSMIDGASAARLHLRTYPAPAGFYVTGIGGSIRVALTRIDELSLNGVPLRNVEFIVGGNELGGGRIGVLGRNFLQLADTEYDFARGVARLLVPKDCGDAQVAYWLHAGDGYSVIGIARPDDSLLLGTRLSKAASFRQPIMSYAYVNGVEMRVMFDTGAGTSILSLKAAARAGIKLDSPGVTPAGFGWGIGRSTVANYLAPVSSFKIGDEEIRNTKLRLGDEEIKGVDMLIGADFFLSHHFYVANSQKKIYFSYNGGPVFNLKPVLAGAQTPAGAVASAAPPAGQSNQGPAVPAAQPDQNPATPAEPGGPPVDMASAQPSSTNEPPANAADAADAARRGQALASRRQFDQALAALTLACRLAPGEPEYFYQRGMIYWQSKQPKLALMDFDRTLQLQPNHVSALLARASMRIQNDDPAGAAADLGTISTTVAKEDAVRESLAAYFLHLRLLPQAIEQDDLWIASHPTDVRLPSALNDRCYARALQGSELPLALADCDQALKHAAKSSPFFAAASNSRALVLLRLGLYDKAIADFDASLKIDAKKASSLYGRGIAEIRANDAPAGQADIAKAQALSPKIADEFAKSGLSP